MADSLPPPVPNLTTDQHAALRLMLEQYWPLEDEYGANYRGIESARAYIERTDVRQTELQTIANQMHDVAMRMGIDLFQAADALRQGRLERNGPVQPSDVARPAIHEPASTTFSPKTFVLEEARRAYPRPVRAAEINRKLRDMGHDVHSKTVGMNFYRFSQQGFVRRQGLDWFFVPESEREPKPHPDFDKAQDLEHYE